MLLLNRLVKSTYTRNTKHTHMSDFKYLDFDLIGKEDLVHWSELWVGDTPGEALTYLLNKVLAVPDADIQVPVLATYGLANTKWCKCLPVQFSYGKPGTGKSTTAMVFSELHDTNILSATSSYPSIRNTIEHTRWLDGEEKTMEADGALLAWDNVDQSTFGDENVRNIFLGGYKRGSDTIRISSSTPGTNITFSCFSAKVMSSVFPLHQFYELIELRRRMLIIFHEKMEDRAGELLDLEDIDWDGIYMKAYWPLFQSEANARVYKQSWLKAKRLAYGPAWNDNRKALCRDLIATAATFGVCKDVREAIDLFTAYWELVESKIGSSDGELKQFLDDWLNNRPGIMNSELMTQIDLWVGTKQLLEKPKAKTITEVMLSFGYKRNLGAWVKEGWKETQLN